MAAYETNILEIAAKKLYANGNGLQSPELRYEKAVFLEWLQQNIALEEVIQVLFKHTCLANGVRLDVYNQYFEGSNTEVLDYILEEITLRVIMMVFATSQRPQDSSVCKILQEVFNCGPEKANEIINIVGSVVNTQYEPRSIAVKEHKYFLEKARNNFLETRNLLCYNIAQKEINHLQTNLTGSISHDLQNCLKIIMSTIQLIHYDLLPSLWNEDIYFMPEDNILQKNTLPSALYNYYSALKNLLDLANRTQEPAQYKAIFIEKIAPFLEILQAEGNSFFTRNLNYHYKWHCLQLSVLLDLPKLIHKAKKATSQNFIKKAQPPTESFAPLLFLAKNNQPHIFADEKKANNKQMHAILLEVIIQMISSKAKPGKQAGIRSPLFHHHCLSQPQELSNEGSPLEDENFLFRTWLLSAHTHNSCSTIYDDFNRVLRASIAQSLPDPLDMNDFKHFNRQIIHYFLSDPMHSFIAVYAVNNNLLSKKYTILHEANQCVASFCLSCNLTVDEFINYVRLSHLLAKELGKMTLPSNTHDSFIITAPIPQESIRLTEDEKRRFYDFKKSTKNISEKEGYDKASKAVKTIEYIKKYEIMIQCLLKMGNLWMNYRDAAKAITLYGHGLNNPYLFSITFEKYQELIEREENSFSQIKQEIYYRVAEKRMVAFICASPASSLIHILSRIKYIVTIIELATYDTLPLHGEKISYIFNDQHQEKYIPSLLYRYREKLTELIERATTAEDEASYLRELNDEIMAFQPELVNDSIHCAWHLKFLTDLYIVVNSLLEKDKKAPSESSPYFAMRTQPTQNHSRQSSSSVSFQYEDRRRSIAGGSVGEIHANDLPQNAEARPATPGRMSP